METIRKIRLIFCRGEENQTNIERACLSRNTVRPVILSEHTITDEKIRHATESSSISFVQPENMAWSWRRMFVQKQSTRERDKLIELPRRLRLHGIVSAFDETVTQGIRRNNTIQEILLMLWHRTLNEKPGESAIS